MLAETTGRDRPGQNEFFDASGMGAQVAVGEVRTHGVREQGDFFELQALPQLLEVLDKSVEADFRRCAHRRA